MAKLSAVEKNNRKKAKADKYWQYRRELKKQIINENLSDDERFEASMKLQKLPRNTSPHRVINRCALTGRPRGFLRKFGLSRIAVRELANQGKLPGVTKSSW
tara:strand:+ start:60736 stop:61041 length:306 start_codon:yes stop_codon:yes gene_type:complete